MKVYTIDAMSSNSMKSSNPFSGVHETQISKCQDTMCLDPSCNQGGCMVCIALEGNGARPSHMGKGFSEDGKMYTLNTIEQHSICYTVNCLDNSLNMETSDYKQPIIIAYAIENHPADSRITMSDNGIVQTLSARCGTGGGNVPMVLMADK